MLLKGIYRQTIDSIRRAHLEFLAFGAKMLDLNQEFNATLAEHQKRMKLIAYDTQILPEKKYIDLCTLLDEVEAMTQRHVQQMGELKDMEAKLHEQIQLFIERCAADHPELDRELIASEVMDTLKK